MAEAICGKVNRILDCWTITRLKQFVECFLFVYKIYLGHKNLLDTLQNSSPEGELFCCTCFQRDMNEVHLAE